MLHRGSACRNTLSWNPGGKLFGLKPLAISPTGVRTQSPIIGGCKIVPDQVLVLLGQGDGSPHRHREAMRLLLRQGSERIPGKPHRGDDRAMGETAELAKFDVAVVIQKLIAISQ